jgi:hypothetical protein
MGLTATNKGGDFELTPAGMYTARCYRVIDLGTQTSKGFQGKPDRKVQKVLIGWELFGDHKMEDGRPFSFHKRYTVSTSEKAALRIDLQAWRGVAFSDEEVQSFQIGKVLGKYALVNLMHESKGKDTYCNLASIMPLPKSMPRPDPVNEDVIFDLDDRNMKVFETLSEKLKETIMAAPEWNKRTQDDVDQQFAAQNHPQHDDDFEDDIPF